jgi:ATP-binding cassette subfamily B protein
MVIKAYNCEDEVLEQFYENNKILYESTWKSQFLMGIMAPLMAFISNFAYVIVCIVGAILITGNKTDLGTIVAFILYVRMFSTPISQFAQNMGGIQPAIASAERVFEFLELDEDIDEGEKVSDQIKGRVTFEHVKFGYVPNRLILKDFSAVVEPGMKVAIVGPTGADKSTLVNLLMRFYEVNSGNIYIDGVSIRDMSRETLHGILAMVLQETWCFNGTIRDNIVYSNADISDDRLLGVVDEVGLSFMVEGLPDGVDTVISDQSSISSGQRQLITIARAMLKNSPIMILDEATSSVDTRTEKYIQSSIDALTKGRTSFVIAHRLSTIQNADVIFVLKDGDIIEVGKHDELIKNGGFYSELYYSQFDVGN